MALVEQCNQSNRPCNRLEDDDGAYFRGARLLCVEIGGMGLAEGNAERITIALDGNINTNLGRKSQNNVDLPLNLDCNTDFAVSVVIVNKRGREYDDAVDAVDAGMGSASRTATSSDALAYIATKQGVVILVDLLHGLALCSINVFDFTSIGRDLWTINSTEARHDVRNENKGVIFAACEYR